jgi:uncharacterized membrane protein
MTGSVAFVSNVVVLGLVVAALWGVADFFGGLATRRARALPVVVIAHGLSLIVLAVTAIAVHAHLPSHRAAVWGLVTGFCSGVGVIAFYSALAAGEMGLTAALTGLLTALVPVIFAFFTEGRPKTTQLIGFALAAAAIWLLAYEPRGRPHARGMWLATLAGFGFGAFLITSKFASRDVVLWPLACSRFASAGLATTMLVFVRLRALARSPQSPVVSPQSPELHSNSGDSELATGDGRESTRAANLAARKPEIRTLTGEDRQPSPRRLVFLLAGGAGLLEALANLLYMLATRAGRLDVAAVLSSLYPAGTILLAVWLLKERVTRRKTAGIVLALAAAAVISL